MKAVFVLAWLIAFAASGCGGGGEAGDAGGETASGAASGVPFDRAFIDAMVPHHDSAILMANEATEAGLTEPELIAIAGNIVITQQREIDQMLAWRETWFGPGSPGSEEEAVEALGLSFEEAGMMHEGMPSGTGVDEGFATMMIEHHEGAVRMAKIAQVQGDHQELKDLATKIIQAQKREIAILEKYVDGTHH